MDGGEKGMIFLCLLFTDCSITVLGIDNGRIV